MFAITVYHTNSLNVFDVICPQKYTQSLPSSCGRNTVTAAHFHTFSMYWSVKWIDYVNVPVQGKVLQCVTAKEGGIKLKKKKKSVNCLLYLICSICFKCCCCAAVCEGDKMKMTLVSEQHWLHQISSVAVFAAERKQSLCRTCSTCTFICGAKVTSYLAGSVCVYHIVVSESVKFTLSHVKLRRIIKCNFCTDIQ